jgi:AbrB family looped-hinge helix DNA binding protein
MRTTARVIANGKVTIPATIRDVLDLEDGDLVEIDVRRISGDREQ